MEPASSSPLRRKLSGWSERLARRPVLTAFVVALGARLLFALVSFAVNHGGLIPDERQYLALAESVASGRGANAWIPGYGQSLYHSTWAFMAPLTRLVDVFGPSRMLGQLLAVGFGAMTAAVAAAVTRIVSTARAALAAGLVVAVMPSQVLWSSVVLRESLVWAALALVGLGVAFVAGRGRRVVVGVGCVGVGVAVLSLTRGQTTVVAAWAAVVVALSLWRRPVVCLAVIGAALLAPVVGGYGVGGYSLVAESRSSLSTTRTYLSMGAESALTPTTVLDGSGTVEQTPDSGSGALRLATRRPVRIVDEHGTVRDVVRAPNGEPVIVDESLGANLRAAPRGLLGTLLRPLPWESSTSSSNTLARVENVGWFGLYVLAALGLWVGRRRGPAVWYAALVCGGLVVVAAVTQGNVGTAFRHRAQLLWALALLAALGGSWLLERGSRGADLAESPDLLP